MARKVMWHGHEPYEDGNTTVQPARVTVLQ